MNRNIATDWRIYLSWWLSGITAGLSIAQFFIDDFNVSKILLVIASIALLINLLILIYAVTRIRWGGK